MLAFKKIDDENYNVYVNKVKAGVLIFDEMLNNWIFKWSTESANYGKELEPAKKALRRDYEMGRRDKLILYFGDFTYNK